MIHEEPGQSMVTLEDHIDLYLDAPNRAPVRPHLKDPRSIVVDLPQLFTQEAGRDQPARIETERKSA